MPSTQSPFSAAGVRARLLSGLLCSAALFLFHAPGVSAQAPAAQPGRDLKLETAAPVTQLPSAASRWALVVGVDQYADRQVSPLFGASNDAAAIADALVKYAGFPREQVILLASNQPEERHPTRSNIIAKLATLAGLVPKDGLFLFSFAGHGMERNGQAFLLPSDVRMSEDLRVLEATGVGVSMLKQWIEDMKVQQVLMLLDACRNDPSAGRAASANPMSDTFRQSFNFDTRNQSVVAQATLYATAVGQRAYEYSEKRQGYFSWAITEALRGGAANEQGEVTLSGLEKFVQEKVPERIRVDLGPGREQRPFAEVKGFKAGELVLAKVGVNAKASGVSLATDPRLQQLEEWDRLKTSVDEAALTSFVKRFPDSPMVDQAQSRIEQIHWDNVRRSKDMSQLRAFREQFPNGRYADAAARSMEQLGQGSASNQAIQNVLTQYVAAYEHEDIDQLRAIWPSLSKKELGIILQSFHASRAIKLDLQQVGDPQVQGDTALVTCRRSLQMQDERGSWQKIADTITLRLAKHGAAWTVDALQ